MRTHQKQRAARIVPRGNGFAARITDARDTKRKWIHGATREEVEQSIARMARVRSDQALGLVNDTERRRLADRALHGALTVGRAWDARQATRPESGSAEQHAATLFELLPGGRACLCEELHGGTLGEWWRAARERYAHATVQSAYYQLRRSIALLVERGLMSRIPWDGEFKPPRQLRPKPRILRTEEEIRALVGAAVVYDDRQIRHHRYQGRAAFVVFMLGTCVRHSEALAVGWDHVWIDDLEGARVIIDRQGPRHWKERQAKWKGPRNPDAIIRGGVASAEDVTSRPMLPTKNGKTRTIRLAPMVVQVLRLHRQQLRALGHYRPEGPVFPDQNGGWYQNGVVLPPHHLAALCASAGVPEVTIHQLRHTGLSHSMASNPDAAQTAQFSGHSDLRTLLERYTHATGAAGLVPSVPLEGGAMPRSMGELPRPVAALPMRAASRTKKGDAESDDRPDFALCWNEEQRRRAAGERPPARPEAITAWAARRGQRAARIAAREGRDTNAARRAAQRLARTEWDRWLAWRFSEVTPSPAAPRALAQYATAPDLPEGDDERAGPTPRTVLPELVFPEDACDRAIREESEAEEMCAQSARKNWPPFDVLTFSTASAPRTVLPELVIPEPPRAPSVVRPLTRAGTTQSEIRPVAGKERGKDWAASCTKAGVPQSYAHEAAICADLIRRLEQDCGKVWSQYDEALAIEACAEANGIRVEYLQRLTHSRSITAQADPSGRRRAGRGVAKAIEAAREWVTP